MSLPRFRRKDGQVVDLEWTRLLTVAEVGAVVPAPPEPRRRAGLVMGEPRAVVEGSGFDRRTVVRRAVLEDDGLMHIAGKVVKARPRVGEVLSYEPARAWSPEDWAAAVTAARDILRQHHFPVDLPWPSPRAWTWSGDQLWWADAPEGDAFLHSDGREEFAVMSGVERAGLGWPEIIKKPDPRALEGWPRFSAFGWAIEIFDAHHFRGGAKAALCRLVAEGQQVERLSPDGEFSAVWPIEDADHLWFLGFAVGAYLAEHRIRANHAKLLERGERNKAATAAGANVGNATKQAKILARRKRALATALDRLGRRDEEGRPVLPDGYDAWSVLALALDVRDHWGLLLEGEKLPKPGVLVDDLRKLIAEGRLSLP